MLTSGKYGRFLRERQRGLLPVGVNIPRLSPGVQQVDALLGLALLAGIVGMHIEAEGAVIELRGTDLDEFGEAGLDILGRGDTQRHHGLINLGRDLVHPDAR
ncbi:Uncharacterised protein [Mycobacteroides abscessus subsp. abscessus]|nr:Uncharacterised protein [Mycobacteroides abscessus subsp. abscessus]